MTRFLSRQGLRVPGVPEQLIKLVTSFIPVCQAESMLVQSTEEHFDMCNGLCHGCSMSPVLFNLHFALVSEKWKKDLSIRKACVLSASMSTETFSIGQAPSQDLPPSLTLSLLIMMHALLNCLWIQPVSLLSFPHDRFSFWSECKPLKDQVHDHGHCFLA